MESTRRGFLSGIFAATAAVAIPSVPAPALDEPEVDNMEDEGIVKILARPLPDPDPMIIEYRKGFHQRYYGEVVRQKKEERDAE